MKNSDKENQNLQKPGTQGRPEFHPGSTTQGGSNYGQGSSGLGGPGNSQGSEKNDGSNYGNEEEFDAADTDQ